MNEHRPVMLSIWGIQKDMLPAFEKPSTSSMGSRRGCSEEMCRWPGVTIPNYSEIPKREQEETMSFERRVRGRRGPTRLLLLLLNSPWMRQVWGCGNREQQTPPTKPGSRVSGCSVSPIFSLHRLCTLTASLSLICQAPVKQAWHTVQVKGHLVLNQASACYTSHRRRSWGKGRRRQFCHWNSHRVHRSSKSLHRCPFIRRKCFFSNVKTADHYKTRELLFMQQWNVTYWPQNVTLQAISSHIFLLQDKYSLEEFETCIILPKGSQWLNPSLKAKWTET